MSKKVKILNLDKGIGSNRDKDLDFFRGVAAVNIILLHTSFHANLPVIIFLTMMFDVPLFLFLSGWSAIYSHNFVNMLSRLMKTWILWAIVILSCNMISLIIRGNCDTPLQFFNSIIFKEWTLAGFNRVGESGWFLYMYFSVVPIMTLLIGLTEKNGFSCRDYLLILIFILVQSQILCDG